MPYNLNMENIIIHSKTRDMLPSISSTILHVRYSEHANSKSVLSSPIWRYPIADSGRRGMGCPLSHYSDVIMKAMASQIIRRLDCLLNRLFRRRSKKPSKIRVTGLCDGNPSVTGGFPSQRTSNAENSSIWWRHHGWVIGVIDILR